MKNALLILVIILVIAGFGYFVFKPAPTLVVEDTVSVGDARFRVEVVSEPEELVQGLSNIESINRDEGMLFEFPSVGRPGIWMKDMKFSIDVMWFNEAGELVDYEDFVDPETYPEIFSPEEDAKYVLEINAGERDSRGIDIGDALTLLR